MTADTADWLLRCLEMSAGKVPPRQDIELNFYGGEPFLNFAVVQYLFHHSAATRYTIFTNGATATSEQIQWCQANRVTPKRSAAGCHAAAALTRPWPYTDRWLAEGKLWGDYGATHRLTVTPKTACFICESVRWLHFQGYFGPVDLAIDDYQPWPEYHRRMYEDELQRLAWEIIRQYKRGNALAIENFANFARSLFGQGDAMVLGCGAGWNTLGITWDGRVVPCHRFFREPPESTLCRTTIADILAGRPLDFGPAYAGRLHDITTGQEETECLQCPARQACPRGCMHVGHAVCGDVRKWPEVRCWWTRLYTKLAREIQREIGPRHPAWWQQKATVCQPFTEE